MTLHSTHLTDEQFAECTSDSAPPDVLHHLEQCDRCREELASLRSSLSDFNDLSFLWAEHQAPARIPVPSRATTYWHRTPVRSLVAAGLVAAVFLTAAHRHSQLSSVPSVMDHDSSTALPNYGSEIASSSAEDDDRLMLAIDRAIVAGQQSPVSAADLGLARASRGSSPARSLND